MLAVLVVGAGLALGAPAGAVAPPPPKRFDVSVSRPSSVWSQAVKLSVALTPKGGGVPRGGTVTFLADGVPVGSAVATTRSTSITTTTLPPGEHAIGADYSGDGMIRPSSAGTTQITIAPAPTAMSVGGDGFVAGGQPVTIKAAVRTLAPAVTSRRPTGTVTFTTACGSGRVAVNANGVATWRRILCPGERAVSVVYDGTDRHASTGPTAIVVQVGDTTGTSAVDQVNVGGQLDFLEVENNADQHTSYAQIFTAGVTGEVDAVDVPSYWYRTGGTAPGPLTASIQTVDADGIPTGTVVAIGSQDISSQDEGLGGDGHIAVDPRAIVRAGTRYALVVETAAQAEGQLGGWGVFATRGDAYPQPLLVRNGDDPWGQANALADLSFRTYVIPATPV
jgi:hypothetical protein